MAAVVLALCSRHKEVFWWQEGDDEFNLYTLMQNWMVAGETFTILEYHPDYRAFPDGINEMSRRAQWWDKQLAELGYDIDLKRWL